MSLYIYNNFKIKKSTISLFLALLSLFKITRVAIIVFLWYILSQALNYADVNLSLLNFVSLVLILTIFLGAFGYLVISNKIRFWHPITWFILTSAIYYGFGPLLYYFGSLETINFVDNYYIVRDHNLFLVNSVVLLGVVAVIVFYLILSGLTNFHVKMPNLDYLIKIKEIDRKKISATAYFLIIIGIPLKLIFTLPHSIGLLDWQLSGFIKNFENFSVLALIPLYLIKDVSLKHKLAFYLLVIFCVITALITLSKLSIIILLIIIFLAAKLKGISNFRAGINGVLILYLYAAVLSPMVTYGRLNFNVAGILSASDARQLTVDVWDGKTSAFMSVNLPGVQGWWARLNYANAQAFAIEHYDAGIAGNTLSQALWVFVPRVLIPDKPNLSHGTNFNELVDGNPYSSSGPGMIVEGYWNAGWYGVIFVSFIMALVYFLWERYINYQLKKGHFQYLPVMFLGIFSALTQDSWFVMSTFGIFTLAVAMHWLIYLLFLVYCFIGKRSKYSVIRF
jgi:hypothetical protein